MRASRTGLAVVWPVAVVATIVYPLVMPSGDSYLLELGLGMLITVFVIGWGLFARARHQLVLSLHERAARLEAEQRLHVEQAREAERRRIAREMHDVLAHRVSLLSLHAGALEFRPDAPPEEIAEAAGVVRAIELVHGGDGMLSPGVTRRLIALVAGDSDAGERRERARALLATLSEREGEVALAVGRGLANAEIAAELHMSVATVQAHVSRLLTKLEAGNRVQVALVVQDAGP